MGDMTPGRVWTSRRQRGPVHRVKIIRVTKQTVVVDVLGPSQRNRSRHTMQTYKLLAQYAPA